VYCQNFYREDKDGDREVVKKEEYEDVRRKAVESGGESGKCLRSLGQVGEGGNDGQFVCPQCKGVTPDKAQQEAEGVDADDSSLVQCMDWQRCPNDKCEKVWGLSSGCNSMISQDCHSGSLPLPLPSPFRQPDIIPPNTNHSTILLPLGHHRHPPRPSLRQESLHP
jgi:hypothetical protein